MSVSSYWYWSPKMSESRAFRCERSVSKSPLNPPERAWPSKIDPTHLYAFKYWWWLSRETWKKPNWLWFQQPLAWSCRSKSGFTLARWSGAQVLLSPELRRILEWGPQKAGDSAGEAAINQKLARCKSQGRTLSALSLASWHTCLLGSRKLRGWGQILVFDR